jgi:trehalose/maltose hydrolase-like predicted phosphorylase
MGLSTAGYYGHVFWDADTYMFPVLLLLHPQIARPIIMFRSRTLDVARANAASHRYQGAMYPWEAGPEGVETTPRFAYQNALYENHVNADVALAAWQYYLATGDRSWLTQYGYPILRATADFWVSRVTYNREKDRYEIGKVVSVIESKIGVNNDPYTNAAAKKNLELASTAAGLLGQPVNPKWGEVAAKLYLPSTESVLIDYPLELPVSPEQRRANVQAALAARPRGAMMGGEFDSILAAESGDRASIDQLLPRSWQPYTRPPFQVLAETPSNQNVNFITGAGAFLQQFLFGYSGLRLGANGLEQRYPPVLPSSVRKLVLQGITIRGVRRTLTITGGRVE